MQASVVLVNQSDQILGHEEIISAHRRPGMLHRASSVFIFRSLSLSQLDQAEVLLQQRSRYKPTAPLKWSNTVCGHVGPNETYQACAQRRLNQELGLNEFELIPLMKITYQVELEAELVEKELDQFYLGMWLEPEQVIAPNPAEVKQYKWQDWTSLIEQFSQEETDKSDFSPWFQYFMQHQELISKINETLITKD